MRRCPAAAPLIFFALTSVTMSRGATVSFGGSVWFRVRRVQCPGGPAGTRRLHQNARSGTGVLSFSIADDYRRRPIGSVMQRGRSNRRRRSTLVAILCDVRSQLAWRGEGGALVLYFNVADRAATIRLPRYRSAGRRINQTTRPQQQRHSTEPFPSTHGQVGICSRLG